MILQRGTFLDLNIAGTLCPFATADGFAMPDTFPFVNRWELHNDLRSRGARLLLTSDEFGVQTASFPKLVARVISEAGVSVVEAIYRSTLLPAKALLIGDEVGSIVEGKKADLVVVAGDLEYDQSGLGHPLDVFKDGIRVENY
jgi:imidazolonepropionase-like amidohydrolase